MERAPAARWVTVSELAEYAYCPRAWWYRDHPPPEGRTGASLRSADRGRARHEKVLGAVAARDRRAGWYVAALGAALVVLAGGVAAWIWG